MSLVAFHILLTTTRPAMRFSTNISMMPTLRVCSEVCLLHFVLSTIGWRIKYIPGSALQQRQSSCNRINRLIACRTIRHRRMGCYAGELSQAGILY